jgi:hypothetical protein
VSDPRHDLARRAAARSPISASKVRSLATHRAFAAAQLAWLNRAEPARARGARRLHAASRARSRFQAVTTNPHVHRQALERQDGKRRATPDPAPRQPAQTPTPTPRGRSGTAGGFRAIGDHRGTASPCVWISGLR